MTRVKRGTIANKRRTKILKYTKGFRWGRKSKERAAKEALLHAWTHSFRGRKEEKRVNRAEWNVQINAAVREHGLTYGQLIAGLKAAGNTIDRKTLADLAGEQVMVQGKVAVMNTLYSGLPLALKDEKGYVFKVRKEAGYYQILNSKELGLVNEVLKLREIGIRRWFLDLDSDVVKKIKWYKELFSGRRVDVSVKEFTKGSFVKEVA